MSNINISKRVAVVLAAPLNAGDHQKLIDLGYEVAKFDIEVVVYESQFLTLTPESITEAGDNLRKAQLNIVDSYIFTKQSEVFV